MSWIPWLTVAAILLAPLVAVQVQKYLEIIRERRTRKLHLFYTLMATRAARLSANHVQALNMIDIEFYGRRVLGVRRQSKAERRVVNSWKVYHDHLNTGYSPEQFEAWIRRGDELFTDLLYEISQELGYDFDRVHLKRGIYAPKGHSEDELSQRFVRDQLIKIMAGDRGFPIDVVSVSLPSDTGTLQGQVQEALLSHLQGKSAVRVRVEQEKSK